MLAYYTLINWPIDLYRVFVECSGSVGRVLDWFMSHCRQNHYVVSLSKTLYLLLITGLTQEDPSQHG